MRRGGFRQVINGERIGHEAKGSRIVSVRNGGVARVCRPVAKQLEQAK
jgi:hypothetical protein